MGMEVLVVLEVLQLAALAFLVGRSLPRREKDLPAPRWEQGEECDGQSAGEGEMDLTEGIVNLMRYSAGKQERKERE